MIKAISRNTIARFSLIFACLFSFQIALSQEMPTLDLNSYKPSSRNDIRVEISSGKSKTLLPISILKGKSQGPVFTIIAGVHGYEYPPIIAAQKILNGINPDKLTGTLIILPLANVEGFYKRSVFYNPGDGKNLNRVFPGKANGSISEKIAHFITNQIITQSDVFLDIHAGDGNEDLVPFICYYDNKENPNKTLLARKLSLAAGFEYNVVYPYTIKKTDAAEYAFKQATQDGKTALSIECGKLGMTTAKDIDKITSGIYSILNAYKMIESQQKNSQVKQLVYNNQFYIKAPAQGIFYSNFKSGQKVTKGELLAYINDEFGKKILEIKSPENGLILYKVGTPPLNVGETVFCIVN